MVSQILWPNQPDKQRHTGALIIRAHDELALPLSKDSGFVKENNIVLEIGVAIRRKKVSFRVLTNCFYCTDSSRKT